VLTEEEKILIERPDEELTEEELSEKNALLAPKRAAEAAEEERL
jgi:hypothetical protein